MGSLIDYAHKKTFFIKGWGFSDKVSPTVVCFFSCYKFLVKIRGQDPIDRVAAQHWGFQNYAKLARLSFPLCLPWPAPPSPSFSKRRHRFVHHRPPGDGWSDKATPCPDPWKQVWRDQHYGWSRGLQSSLRQGEPSPLMQLVLTEQNAYGSLDVAVKCISSTLSIAILRFYGFEVFRDTLVDQEKDPSLAKQGRQAG